MGDEIFGGFGSKVSRGDGGGRERALSRANTH